MIIDFSQNFLCKYAKEVHATHFGGSKNQISLQTGGFYFKNAENKLCFESCASISETLTHDAPAVWAHLQPLILHMLKCIPGIKTVYFQSDGPSTQYKNKTNFFLISYFCKYFGWNNCYWNYTAAGHGKSAADGIGGSIKEMCNTAVSCGEDVLGTADVVRVVEGKNSKIKVFVITENDIEIRYRILYQKI